ncbi:DivIVA domain-containing protein [Actinomadura graeca]|uniref:Cell wall synthesis protein Wag31 n=1 Tax=Actinomadura graeca TaxID=2750812 RepID=A0ABX8R357_9ACTN|nr:DivIVA domain-containing protein [Actinomadura graeca]QXJ24874.1 DivIVA domain-containing protein [Actinomadura graeca]
MNSPNLPVVSDGARLTPGEIQSVVFARAARGRRGYDEGQVRTFLRRVERELVQILKDKAALTGEVDRLRAQVAKGGPAVLAPEDAHFQAVRILSQAQQTADLYVADAERYTRELAHEARLHREAILFDAKGRAEHLLEDAHRKAAEVAEAVVRSGASPSAAVPPAQPAVPAGGAAPGSNNAGKTSDKVVAGAGSGTGGATASGTAGAAPSAASGSLVPGLVGQSDEERRRMEQEIAYLRTYSDVYRTHLRSYLEALLRNVDEWESSERASLPRGLPGPQSRS